MQPPPYTPPLTPRRMAENRWQLLIACEPCRVLRCFEAPSMIDARLGEYDYEAAFNRGKLICDRCRTPAVWMKVEYVARSTRMTTELRVWERPGASSPPTPPRGRKVG